MSKVTWNASTDRKLLLRLLKNTKLNYEDGAAALSVSGVECTEQAVKSRIEKLRALDKKSDNNNEVTDADANKVAPTTPKAKDGKKGAKRATASLEDDDDEGEKTDEGDKDKPSPSKKACKKAAKGKTKAGGNGKKAGKSRKTAVKEEDEEEEQNEGEEEQVIGQETMDREHESNDEV